MKTNVPRLIAIGFLALSLAACSSRDDPTVGGPTAPAAGISATTTTLAAAPQLRGDTALAEQSRTQTSVRASRPERRGAVPGELLVKFKAQTTRTAIINTLHKVSVQRIATFKAMPRLSRVRIAPGVDIAEAMAAYQGDPNVEYVEPNYFYSIAAIPNDPQFAEQWGLHNTGQVGLADADIDAPEAWDITTGSNTVVVAVIDSGVDYTHPDLAANVFTNAGDCDGDGTDDDGNGYVDDCHGIDAINDDSDPADDEGHGTHVAGIIGAAGNNGLGVTGVAWNVRILPCKFIGADGFGTAADAIECLDYVTLMKQRGVNVVATNNSWAGVDDSQALRDAIVAQRDLGILFIAAAGNSGDNIDAFPEYPCSIGSANVVCVAAYTALDQIAFFSNVGDFTVHVGAPGDSILSTTPGNSYDYKSGTSMATPHVSGIVALLAAQEPARSWIQTRNLVLASGDRDINLDPILRTVSKRRVNAHAALTCSDKVLSARVSPRFHYREIHRLGDPLTLAAIHINCGLPAGPITVSITPSGESIVLADNGVGVDEVANDGIYSAQWTPQAVGLHVLDFAGTAPSTAQARVVVDRDLKPGFPVKTVADAGSYSPPLYVTLGDVAGDARLEIMATGLAAGPLHMWHHDGKRVPGWPRVEASGFPEFLGAAYPVLAQLDPASARREVFISHYGGQIAGYGADATYLAGWPRTLGARLGLEKYPVSFDIDADGIDEIFVYDSGDVHVLRGDGAAFPGWLPFEGLPPAIGDLDGDEKPEVVWVDIVSNGVFEVHAVRQNGTALPGFPVSYDFATDVPLIGDIDGNGRNEIIFVSSAGVSTLTADGVITQVVPTLIPAYLISESTASLGDLDQDGIPEIVMQATHRPGVGYTFVTVFAWHGNGTPLAGFPVELGELRGNGQSTPVIADVDSDGAADIVLSTDAAGNTQLGTLWALKNDGTVINGFPKEFQMGSGMVPAVGDLDANGHNDIVVGSSAWEGVSGAFDGVWAFEVAGPVANGPIEWGQTRGGPQHHAFYELGKNLPQHAFLTGRVIGGGSITAPGLNCGTDCIERVAKGSNVTLTATPAPGATFSRWLGACAGQANPCTVTVQRFRSVIAEFNGGATLSVTVNGAGSVSSDPTGISCPGDCSENFADGATIRLSAVAGAGSVFTGWLGACTGTDDTCTVTMDASKSVIATFAEKFVLSVETQGTGSGVVKSQPAGIQCQPDCSGAYLPNTAATLTATAATGSDFAGWSGACSGSNDSCTVIMDAAKTVIATFTARPVLTVEIQGSGSGIVSSQPGTILCPTDCSETHRWNASVTLTATERSGSQFTGWSGGCTGTAKTCTVIMDAVKTVIATFTTTITNPVLSIVTQGTGTGLVTSQPGGIQCPSDCSEPYASNISVTLTAAPGTDSEFVGWSGACSGTASTCTVTMAASKSVTATFQRRPILSVVLFGSGSGTVTSSGDGISCGSDCSEPYQSGASVTLTATPASGSVFSGWSGACTGMGACTLTMSSSHTASATFTVMPVLTVTVSGSGSVTSNPGGIACGTACTQAFAPSAAITLTATAASGNEFSAWSGVCAGQGNPCSITMDSAKSAGATFRASPPPAGNSGGGGGGGGSANLLGVLALGALWLARRTVRASARTR